MDRRAEAAAIATELNRRLGLDFINWKAAEAYYANSLREAGNYFDRHPDAEDEEDEEEEEEARAIIVERDDRTKVFVPCPTFNGDIGFARSGEARQSLS